MSTENTFVCIVSNVSAPKKYFRDHCHITGQYRGSAHQNCNLKLRISPKEFKIPVIFHNLRGYDSHFIMQEIGSIGKSNNLDINCVPNNMEKYMAFMLGKHTYIQTYILYLRYIRNKRHK